MCVRMVQPLSGEKRQGANLGVNSPYNKEKTDNAVGTSREVLCAYTYCMNINAEYIYAHIYVRTYMHIYTVFIYMLLCHVCCTHTDLTGVPSTLQNATPLRMCDRMSSVIPYLWLVVRNLPVTPP